MKDTGKRFKLVIRRGEVSVKIEVTPVLRGSVYPVVTLELSKRATAEFGFASMPVLSLEDLYAGKICAALDRQHPRDLYDVRWLFQHRGIDKRLKNAFLVYLMSHDRPMAELLAPKPKDIAALYETQFAQLAYEPVSLEILQETLPDLVRRIHAAMTDRDRRFLIAFKQGSQNWQDFPLPEAERLPAIQWKMLNLARMSLTKRQAALAILEKVLSG